MTEQRRRRIVRRAVMATAGIVLLLASYVSAWLVFPTAEYRGIVRGEAAHILRVVLSPVGDYCRSNLPGTAFLMDWQERLNEDVYEASGIYGNTRTPQRELPFVLPEQEAMMRQLRRKFDDEHGAASESQQSNSPATSADSRRTDTAINAGN